MSGGRRRNCEPIAATMRSLGLFRTQKYVGDRGTVFENKHGGCFAGFGLVFASVRCVVLFIDVIERFGQVRVTVAFKSHHLSIEAAGDDNRVRESGGTCWFGEGGCCCCCDGASCCQKREEGAGEIDHGCVVVSEMWKWWTARDIGRKLNEVLRAWWMEWGIWKEQGKI